jgi:hypothetical protein
MGKGIVPKEKLAAFLLAANPEADESFIGPFAGIYLEEALAEGVNHDVAFAQMCLETGFLRFGNLVSIDMNNFAGLGATGNVGPDGKVERGIVFPDTRTGIRAHIQHLKAYATTDPLNLELVNPRFRFVEMLGRRGSAPTISGLTGKWATDPQYSNKISAILGRLYESSF